MILRFLIRLCLFGFMMGGLYAQDNTLPQNDDSKSNLFLYDRSRQRFGAVSVSYQLPIPTGTNFIGQGFSGDQGYSANLRLFPYKQFFIAFSYGMSEFNVKDRSVVGNYNSANAEERYFALGYEFLPLKKFRFGVNASVGGRITLTNRVTNSSGNKDTGRLIVYGLNLDYELSQVISVFCQFAFKRMKTDIIVPGALSNVFEEGTYNTINIGLRFSFGRDDIFSRYFK